MLTFLCSARCGHYRCGRGCVGGKVGRRAFELLGEQLCVDLQAFQSFSGEVSLKHRCFFITIIQSKGYVSVSGGPGRTKVNQTKLMGI